jgi:hypothetical protein
MGGGPACGNERETNWFELNEGKSGLFQMATFSTNRSCVTHPSAPSPPPTPGNPLQGSLLSLPSHERHGVQFCTLFKGTV